MIYIPHRHIFANDRMRTMIFKAGDQYESFIHDLGSDWILSIYGMGYSVYSLRLYFNASFAVGEMP